MMKKTLFSLCLLGAFALSCSDPGNSPGLRWDFELELPAGGKGSGEGELRGLGYGGNASMAEPMATLGYTDGSGDDQWQAAGTLDRSKLQAGADGTRGNWKPAGAALNAVHLRVGDADELPLRGAEVSAWVEGFRARVLMDLVFENTFDKTLEGTFKLRLPDGASPYYLAFGEEVLAEGTEWKLPLRDRALALGPEPERVAADRTAHWKGAREARMVPRAQAAKAYKDTVRQAVDPALLEWSGAGIFQTRVYPLVPHGFHRIVVGYEMDLVPVAGQSGLYEFNLSFPEELRSLSLDLNIRRPVNLLMGSPEPLILVEPAGAEKAEDGTGRLVHRYPLTEERSFRVLMQEPDAVALVAEEDGGFFGVDFVPGLQAQVDSQNGAQRPGIFMVDTSLSSAAGGYPIWLDLMERILSSNRDSMPQFAVLFFDVAPRWWRPEFSANTTEAVAELRAYAESLALEGASDLGTAMWAAMVPHWLHSSGGPGRNTFLLSDGAATWGTGDVNSISRAARMGTGGLFAYHTGLSGSDRGVLEQVTRESGGALFSVTGAADLEHAARAHHSLPWQIDSVSLNACSDLLLRGRPSMLFAGQRLRLVGRGRPRLGDEVVLELSQSGLEQTLRIPLGAVLESPLGARTFGEVATQQLERFGSLTASEAAAFATRFRVTGKACSLLMLESEADYQEQGILSEQAVMQGLTAQVGRVVAGALEVLAGKLGDPLHAFLERLEPLAAAGVLGAAVESGVEELLAPGLLQALEGLASLALKLETEKLEFRSLLASQRSAAIEKELASGEPGYDVLQAEVARRLDALGKGDGVRLLSSLVELNPGDGVFLRDVAQSLMQLELYGHAYHLFLRVAEARPFEPQSYLSLARCAEERGQLDLALAWYSIAIQGEWDSRFGDFRSIALFDAVHLQRRIESGELSSSLSAALANQIRTARLASGLERVDLAVVIQWNTDATDLDLHILEPEGGHVFYSQRESKIGGQLSKDVTQGYGPELYVLPQAAAGEYTFYAHYFSSDAKRTSVRSKLLATVYLDWGGPDERVLRRELTLEQEGREHGIVQLVLE
jgi:tetratricopeptide (TPR) repeat protein